MTVNPHTAAAIAQLVFYVPIVPLAYYLLIRNWRNGPRMAWYPPVPFSLVRLAGAILIIVEEQKPGNTGLIIATIVLLNVGLVPIIMAFLGVVRLVIRSNFPDSPRATRFTRIIRLNLLLAVALLSASGAFAGQPQHADTQSVLSKVAYFQFAGILVAMIAFSGIHYSRSAIKAEDRIYLKWALIASPFLIVRTIYGLISVFDANGSRILTSMWSPLFGSATAFALMALLMEYIALWCFLYLSIHRLRTSRQRTVEMESEIQSQPKYVV